MENKTAPSEPVLTVGTIVAFVQALLGLLVTFGLRDYLTPQTQAVIITFVMASVPLVQAVISRDRVSSPATVERLVSQARNVGTTITVPSIAVPTISDETEEALKSLLNASIRKAKNVV